MSGDFSASEYSSDDGRETRRNSESDSDEESQLVVSGAGSRLRPAGTALKFLSYAAWQREPDIRHSDEPPEYLRYTIDWKLSVNNRSKGGETEQNIVIAPNKFWRHILRGKLQAAVKHARQPLTETRTKIVLSTTGRRGPGPGKVTLEDRKWLEVAAQLQEWSEFLLAGKKLIVDITFHYETNNDAASKPGRGASNRQRAERAARADAVQTIFGRKEAYEQVFKIIRCPPDSHCNRGPYCWQDPDAMNGKKHYKLRDHQLRALVEHVQQGSDFTSHKDMPDDIKEQLYREEQQHADRVVKPKRKRSFSDEDRRPTAIHVHNIVPGQAGSAAMGHETVPPSPWLDLPGYRDDAVDQYYAWHCSQVRCGKQKENFNLARTLTKDHGYDLQLVYDARDKRAQFFREFGVLEGVAIRWTRDVKKFIKQALETRGDALHT
ncbi:hypothetical protein PWT90_10011 [Aphanocladium album]|nr:hypothetical protein PWT90_10011 [Aphanocladium album]